MVVVDEAFKGSGKKPGLEIWRIKEFRVLPIDKSEYGQFYSGDSYIVLSTREVEKKLVHDVHLWLGDNTTQDEYGTAAIKTVELDDLLGGGPVQYRELQDHESSLFLSYFKNGIKYLKGGYESGFHHVEDPKFEPRLFQCKGKRNVRVRQVDLSKDSLNMGDVFILDAGLDIYAWMPPESGRLERIKGIQQATNIRDQERAGRGTIHVLDSDWDTNEELWGHLGGPGPVSEASSDEAYQVEHERREKPHIQLHKVSDAGGKMAISKVGEADLANDMLESKDAFILDAASGGIYVWIGKGCTMDERKKAMVWASDYLSDQGRPPWIQVVRVLESAEPAIFTQWFNKPPPNRPKFMQHLFQCSDESGKLIIEEISNFTQEDLDGDDVMILDSGPVVYVWIGSGANDNEKRSALSIAQKYLDTDGLPRPSGAKLVSIEQGAEPSDFTKYFKSWDPDSWMGTIFAKIGLTLHAKHGNSVPYEDKSVLLCNISNMPMLFPTNGTATASAQCGPVILHYTYSYQCNARNYYGINCNIACSPINASDKCYTCSYDGQKNCCQGYSTANCTVSTATTINPTIAAELDLKRTYYIAMWALAGFGILTLLVIIALSVALVVYCRRAKKYQERSTPLRSRSRNRNAVFPATRSPVSLYQNPGKNPDSVTPRAQRTEALRDNFADSPTSLELYARPQKPQRAQKPSVNSSSSEYDPYNESFDSRPTARPRPPSYEEHTKRHQMAH